MNYQDESEESSMEESSLNAFEDSETPLPRDHSYLIGSSHPLMASQEDKMLDTASGPTTIATPVTALTDVTELAILEVSGVVLFPGSTIPVKLRDPSWIAYLGHQIEVCRTLPHLQPQVRLGILTHEPRHQTIRRQRRHVQRRQRQNHQSSTSISDSDSDDSDNSHHGPRQEDQDHPFLNRVGTIATIQYTKERNSAEDQPSLSSHVWRRYQEMDELVFTAVGTGRFRVVGLLPKTSEHHNNIYRVEELKDRPIWRPPYPSNRIISTRPRNTWTRPDTSQEPVSSDDNKDHSPLPRHAQMTWNLSRVTPVPYFVYDLVWPWRIVENMVDLLQKNKGRSNLPNFDWGSDNDRSDKHSLLRNPTAFSFWMASNMPFTEAERLDLLQLPCTMERLQFLQERVEHLVETSTVQYIGCARCDSSLTMITNVFQFQGAEGATSNYVNDHGYIHQITTLRSVEDERRLYLDGPASTHNSYFPGYSWTITYCRRCASLLGWKFKRVVPHSIGPTQDSCPDEFYGFMSSNVSTTTAI